MCVVTRDALEWSEAKNGMVLLNSKCTTPYASALHMQKLSSELKLLLRKEASKLAVISLNRVFKTNNIPIRNQ